MKKKILIAVLIIFLLLSGVVGLGFVNIRNACIDTMKAEVTTSEGCYYTDEDIEKAIFTVKEIYKKSFSKYLEEMSQKVQSKSIQKMMIIQLLVMQFNQV